MRQQGILDTGPLVAMLKKDDELHFWAADAISQSEPPFYTCESVLSEACFLLRALPTGPERVMELLHRGWLEIPFRLSDEAPRVYALIRRYADVPMSLADACLVRMAEQYEGSVILTHDSDFRIYRIHGRKAITLAMP